MKIVLLNVDYTDEDIVDNSDAIEQALSRLFRDVPIILQGQCADSGGGGTKHAFERAM